MAGAELFKAREQTEELGEGDGAPASSAAPVSLRGVLRAALPWAAAALVTATSLEPHLTPRGPDPILFDDQAPPAPRRVPKIDPDTGHSLAVYPA